MKRTIIVRSAIYLFAVIVFSIVAESCKTGKNCGCGSDLMGTYKPPRRHR